MLRKRFQIVIQVFYFRRSVRPEGVTLPRTPTALVVARGGRAAEAEACGICNRTRELDLSISQPNGDVKEHRFNGRKPESIARGPEGFKVLLAVGRELIKRGYTRGHRLIVCQVRPLPVGLDSQNHPIDLIIGPASTAGNEARGAACK